MDMFIGIAVKLIVGALGIFTLLRIVGKKAMSEVTPFDLIYTIILGALVEEAIYDNQVNILHVLFAILLWGIIVFIVEKIVQRADKLSTVLQGEPAVLIEKGKLNMYELNKNYFDMEQLRTMLRMKGIHSINDVYYAVLEVSGDLTVTTKESMEIPTFLLLEHGNIKKRTLNSLDKDENWLRSELSKKGYDNVEDLIYVEWNENSEELIVETYSNTIERKILIDD